jgi:hypothetical protein
VKLDKDKLKAKAKKYAPYVQAVAATAAAAYYMRENNRLKDQIEMRDYIDENTWPVIEITPNCYKDFREGATLRARMFHTEDPRRTKIQMTTRDEEGFPVEADEDYAKGKPGEAPYTHI